MFRFAIEVWLCFYFLAPIALSPPTEIIILALRAYPATIWEVKIGIASAWWLLRCASDTVVPSQLILLLICCGTRTVIHCCSREKFLAILFVGSSLWFAPLVTSNWVTSNLQSYIPKGVLSLNRGYKVDNVLFHGMLIIVLFHLAWMFSQRWQMIIKLHAFWSKLGFVWLQKLKFFLLIGSFTGIRL